MLISINVPSRKNRVGRRNQKNKKKDTRIDDSVRQSQTNNNP